MRVTPFLLFEGNCAEAMEFYRSCLGGELSITRLGDRPMKADVPVELGLEDKVVYATCAAATSSSRRPSGSTRRGGRRPGTRSRCS
jgi:uncharacterized glyoxalase superfamily protein PhnB